MVDGGEENMSVSTDSRVGSDFLRYRIEALLGRGGMSVVYRAHHTALDRNVALKLLAPELGEDERFRERFLRESKLAASLDHPSIVPVYDAGEVEGQLYIAMRYVEGSDLKRLLREEGALDPGRALRLVGQLADALDFAHARGLVHRDVKPSNALLDSHGHLYLSDFGLTKSASDRSALTATGRIIGTIDYAAPEQIEGRAIDGRADVYSLGCLLYECLAGEVPYPRDSELAVLWAHVHEPPPKLAAYPALDPVIAKALARDPEDRFQSCADLVEAARAALGLRDVVVVRDRRPFVLLAAGVLVSAGAVAAGLALTLGRDSGPKASLNVRANTVVRIDTATGKITAVTPVGDGPESIAVGGGTVWVHNWRDETVSKLDLRTGSLRGTVGLAGSASLVPAQTIAADAGGAWVAQGGPGGGVLTHIRPGRLLPEEITLPGTPSTVAIGMNAVWVGVRSLDGSFLLELDPADRSTRRTVRLPFDDPVQSIAVGGGAVWVANSGLRQTRLVRIDPSTGEITKQARIPTQGGGVSAIAFGSGAVWLAQVPQALLRIAPRTLRVTKTIPAPPTAVTAGSAGGGVGNLVLGDGQVWWSGTDTGDLWRVDPRTGNVASVHLAQPIGEQQVESVLDMFEPLGTAFGGGSVWVTMSLPF